MAEQARSVPNELKSGGVRIDEFKREGNLITYVYDLESMPPETTRVYCANLFKSLAEFQFNVMKPADGTFRISLSMSFNPSKSPTTFDADVVFAKRFDIHAGNNKIELKALEPDEHKGVTRIPRSSKSIVLYRCSVYFAENRERITEAISEYADIDVGKIIVPLKNGVFDGTIRIPVKRFKKVPPHSICVPEYYPDGSNCAGLERSILVRSYGYEPETPRTVVSNARKQHCEACQRKGMNPEHDPRTCRHKKCKHCLQYNSGCGITKETCQGLSNILQGRLPKKQKYRKKAIAKKNEGRAKPRGNKNSSNESRDTGPTIKVGTPEAKAQKITNEGQGSSTGTSSDESFETADFDDEPRTTQVETIFNQQPDSENPSPVITTPTEKDNTNPEKMLVDSETQQVPQVEESLPAQTQQGFKVPAVPNPFAQELYANNKADTSDDISDMAKEEASHLEELKNDLENEQLESRIENLRHKRKKPTDCGTTL
jgi:hypothetical protein